MPEVGKDSAILIHKSPRLPLDRINGGVGICDTNHSQVHAGNAYHHSQSVSLGAGASLVHTMSIPVGTYVHFQNFAALLGLQWNLVIIEGDTPTTGTQDIPVNRNRIKNFASEVVLHDNPVSTGLVPLLDLTMPGNLQKLVGVEGSGIEWVLSPGKSYTFTLTNQGAQAVVGYLQLDWYEETSG